MTISASNVELYLSGGTDNTDPAASIGGARASTALGTYDCWDMFPEAIPGHTYYRCLYVRNEDSNANGLLAPRFWAEFATLGGLAVQIGLGAAAKNGTETAITDGETAPSGVSFQTAQSYTAGVDLPDLAEDDYQAVWIKVTVTELTTGGLQRYVKPHVGGYSYDSTTYYGNSGVYTASDIGLDSMRGAKLTIGSAGTKYIMTGAQFYVDGSGSGAGSQELVRYAMYDDSSNYPGDLEGATAEGAVADNAAGAWKHLDMQAPFIIDGGNPHWLLIHAGASNAVARYYRQATGSVGVSGISDTYSDGPADPCNGGGTVNTMTVSCVAIGSALTYLEANPVNFELWPDEAPPTEDTLDVIRIYKGGSYEDPVDITSATDEGPAEVTITEALNAPGSLELSLAASTVKAANNWLDENSAVELWLGGARVGAYLIDAYTPQWAAAVARVNCIGALALADRDLVPAGTGSYSPSAIVGAAASAVEDNTIGRFWRRRYEYYSDLPGTGSIYSDGEGQTFYEWVRDLLPLWGDHGMHWWIDGDWYLHAEPLKDPATDTADITYAMGDNAVDFTTTYSARDIYNYVRVECPNAPSPYYVICEDTDSQDLYGYRRAPNITYNEATTLAAASAYGGAEIAKTAYPTAEVIVTAKHQAGRVVGQLAQVTGLDDDRTYKGIVQQRTWTVGSDYDEVVLSAKPLTINTALLAGYDTLRTALRRI